MTAEEEHVDAREKVTAAVEHLARADNVPQGCSRVLAVWSAGDSDLGYETVIFLDERLRPFTGWWSGAEGEAFTMRPGW